MDTMPQTLSNSCLLIEVDKLRANVRTILRTLPEWTRLIPVIKDDAYGLGAVGIARILSGLPRIDCFAVAHVSEGIELRRAGVRQEILVMGNALPHQFAAAVEHDLTLTVGRLGMVGSLAQSCAAQGKTMKVHIKIETGLHRIGVDVGAELSDLAAELHAAKDTIRPVGAFSHFAQPDSAEICRAQYELFMRGVEQLRAAGIAVPLLHIGSSESSEFFPEYSLDAVRIGRRLYMDHPTSPRGDIQEVVSWRSYITNVKLRRAGDTLGYGGAYRLEKDALVATIGIGYGDGLSEAFATSHAEILVRGKLCPLLTCCMDQCFADVSGLAAEAGDEVTIFGGDGAGHFISAQDAANRVGANEGCGLTAALSPRVARLYV